MRLGTPLSPTAVKVMLLGAGELGKEVAIDLQRLGVEVIAVDRYANAPAMQVAHRSHVISMLDGAALRAVIEQEQPHYIVPEIEAIATDTLVELEAEGFTVVPTALMKCSGVRRGRSRPGLLTSRAYSPATGSSTLSAREIDRCSWLMVPMSAPPGRSTSTWSTPPFSSRS